LTVDTDGDGFTDYQEVMGGSDPLNKDSKPVQADTLQIPSAEK
jgi:hypothetical protein